MYTLVSITYLCLAQLLANNKKLHIYIHFNQWVITDTAAFFDPYDTLHSPWELIDFVGLNRDGTPCYSKSFGLPRILEKENL